MPNKKKCFVVMGFGEKTDYRTSRVLDLNKTYKHIIKKAAEDAGLECIRADEIPHAGTIEIPMFEQLLEADLVIADLSTSNLNAAYELGVRHALKPRTTIIIAENEFVSPFDTAHISTLRYKHDGKALDIDEVERFRTELKNAIVDILANGMTDSPVYTFLKPLTPPVRDSVTEITSISNSETDNSNTINPALAVLIDKLEEAKKVKDFETAKNLLKIIIGMSNSATAYKQQLALLTYKSKIPDEQSALIEAQGILRELNPMNSNNAETLGLWGAVHKRLFEINKNQTDLDIAIRSYEKGYRLLSDYYNGINLAFLLNVRASLSELPDSITDYVLARRTRVNVLEICKPTLESLKDSKQTRTQRYWILATMAEAYLGIEDIDQSGKYLKDAKEYADEQWMLDSTQEQLGKLRNYLDNSPLKHIKN